MRKSRLPDREIIKLCREDGLSPAMVAPRYGVTRQAIWKLLKRNGIDTSKTAIKSTCAFCGAGIEIPRYRFRRDKKHYCGMRCYYDDLNTRQGGNYVPWRHGQRIARATVAKYYDLQPNQVVHHKNRDARDNRIENLCVFRTSGEHTSYHRGGQTRPVWDGAALN